MPDLVEQIGEIVHELPYDLRAEVVLADMLQRGISIDSIVIRSNGLFKRKFSKDVEKISVNETKDGQRYALIELNREGIYDAIPQALTHSSKRKNDGVLKTTLEMVDEVKVRRQEENNARLFFLPFENEFHHQSLQLEIEEQNILKGYLSNTRYSALMNRFWQLPEFLDQKQKATFIYLLPIIHKAVGNLDLTKLCYEAILNTKVNLNLSAGFKQDVKNLHGLSDGKLKLGVNFVCGSSLFSETQLLDIVLGPLNKEQLVDFLPGGKGREVIEFLNDYFIPFDVFNKLKIISPVGEAEFILSNENSNLRLGFTSYLYPKA